jgi:hypothetical protein
MGDAWATGVERALKDGTTEEDLLHALETLREAASGRGASDGSGAPNPRVDPVASSTLAQLASVARRVAACSLTGDGSGCRTGFCVLVAQLFGSGHRRAAPSASSAACDSTELLSLMQVLHATTTLQVSSVSAPSRSTPLDTAAAGWGRIGPCPRVEGRSAS